MGIKSLQGKTKHNATHLESYKEMSTLTAPADDLEACAGGQQSNIRGTSGRRKDPLQASATCSYEISANGFHLPACQMQSPLCFNASPKLKRSE